MYEQASRFHDDGRAKPSVALVPVFDRSEATVGWNLSEEFTDHLRQRFLKKNQFYLATPEEVNEKTTKLSQDQNPFTNHYSWVKETFSGQEFVIFVELIEHDIHPKKLQENFLDKISPSSEISISMRVRVFDLREEEPAIILQEIVHQDHLIPQPSDLAKEDPEKWKKLIFNFSPLGLAHLQIAKEVSTRIEDYILVAQSK
ncbi:MAG: hypothetical protein HYZ47_04880 [Simkania negevensis]|nr:hypothetical protein [Simkania negevensis]